MFNLDVLNGVDKKFGQILDEKIFLYIVKNKTFGRYEVLRSIL